MFPAVVLQGRRVRLRPVTETDLPCFLRWLHAPDINRWLAMPESGPPATLEAEHTWYERTQQDPHQLVWAIETHGGQLLGNVALHRGFRADAAELGLFIGERGEWSKGYGTDAVRTILGHAFGLMGFRRVYLHTDVENQRAHRCFARCGVRQEGLVKEYRRRWGEARCMEGFLMAILARAFTGSEPRV
jgi:RimJ/RimL family protein N-acetyltransferase